MKTLKQFIEEQMEVHPENVASALEQARKDHKNSKTREEEEFHEKKIAALEELMKSQMAKKLN